ncbi:hypothetical protein EsH8_VII_000642 [Colletotrichum jinshuiense]
MCLRIYRHFTACGCYLSTGSLRECPHGPTSPLCGPQHAVGIVVRKGEKCAYHARVSKSQEGAPPASMTQQSDPIADGGAGVEAHPGRLQELGRSVSVSGTGAADPLYIDVRQARRIFAAAFSASPYRRNGHASRAENKDTRLPQNMLARFRDEFVALIDEAPFEVSDRLLSPGWDDDDDDLQTQGVEMDIDAETTKSEETAPEGAVEGEEEEEEDGDADEDDENDHVQDEDGGLGNGGEESSSEYEEEDPYVASGAGIEWTSKLKYMTGIRSRAPMTD